MENLLIFCPAALFVKYGIPSGRFFALLRMTRVFVILNVVKDRLERQNLRILYYRGIYSAEYHHSGRGGARSVTKRGRPA